MSIELSYGIRNGKVMPISDLGLSETGEKCNCTCPHCDGMLVAQLDGDLGKCHFKHREETGCDVQLAQLTGLYLLAKEIIYESGDILLPGYSISRREITSAVRKVNGISKAGIRIDLPEISAGHFEYVPVNMEKMHGDISADAVICIQGRRCIVEITVSDPADEERIRKLEALGCPCFLIDLSELAQSPQTYEAVTDAVLYGPENRYWINNPKRNRQLEIKRCEFQKKYDALVEQRRLAELRKARKRQEDLIALQHLMEPEAYADILSGLRNDEQAALMLEKFYFSEGLDEYPFFTDIPITGEFVFNCDRRIWQGKLFNDYVWRCQEKGTCMFRISEIQKRISKGKTMLEYDRSKVFHTPLEINGRREDHSFSYDVIHRYFCYLELLGFVKHYGYEWFSQRPSSLEPPNEKYAGLIKDILVSVDRTAPDIDQVIGQELLSRLTDTEQAEVISRFWKI